MKETFDISGWQKARDKKRLDREGRRKTLLKEAQQRVPDYFSKNRKEVKRVFLTGSVLEPEKFHQYSDIDIAVEGLPEVVYFRTKVELEELLNVNVDLIELENCTFRDRIETYGLRIV